MVFLGGAVLANIVSRLSVLVNLEFIFFTDGREGKYVVVKAGMGGAGPKGARDQVRWPVEKTMTLLITTSRLYGKNLTCNISLVHTFHDKSFLQKENAQL